MYLAKWNISIIKETILHITTEDRKSALQMKLSDIISICTFVFMTGWIENAKECIDLPDKTGGKLPATIFSAVMHTYMSRSCINISLSFAYVSKEQFYYCGSLRHGWIAVIFVSPAFFGCYNMPPFSSFIFWILEEFEFRGLYTPSTPIEVVTIELSRVYILKLSTEHSIRRFITKL